MLNPVETISHHFSGGVYCKLMRIKEDHQVVTHKHAFDHMSALMSGCVIVEYNGIQETYYAPDIIEIKAGIDHRVIAVNGPAIWACIHATDCTDETKVDDVLIERIDKPEQNMHKLDFTFDVSELINQIESNPSLWDRFTMRTRLRSDSPHREVSDIWLRYRDWEEFDADIPESFSDEHVSQFYPAYYELPEAQSIIAKVMDNMPDHAKLGGCLITKIPAWEKVYPHSDAGAWHSTYFNRKILILLQSAPGQSFNFDNESHEGKAGEVFSFDNHPMHSVVNNSGVDRISLILAIRDIPDEQ